MEIKILVRCLADWQQPGAILATRTRGEQTEQNKQMEALRVCMSPAPRACHYLFSWPQSNHGSNPNQIPVGVYIGVVFKHSGTAVREKDTVVCP